MPREVLMAVLAGLVGWCLGWLSAWVTDYLQRQDGLPSAGRGPLVRDIFVQAGSALVWAAAPLLIAGEWWRWVAAGLIAVPLIQVTITDFRHRYVYTAMAVVGAVLGVALGWLVHGGEWWYGLLGAAGGFASFLLLYLAGLLAGRVFLGSQEPLARGDITIAAMVGAGAGACAVSALFLGVLLSGLIALAILLTRRRGRLYFAYGPGLCLGGLITLFRC